MTSENTGSSLDLLEKLLAHPPCSGLCATFISEDPSMEGAEIAVGDIVTKVNGVDVLTVKDLLKQLQPTDARDVNEVVVLRGSNLVTCKIPVHAKNFEVCAVSHNKPSWETKADTDYVPDFSRLISRGTIWLRNSFEDTCAGYERIHVECQDDTFDVSINFHLSGGDGEARWHHATRIASVHRADKYLSLLRTAYWVGQGKEETLHGELQLKDGHWHGTRRTPGGDEQELVRPANRASLITGYTQTILPITMPLIKDACLSVILVSDGKVNPRGRTRFECKGRERVVNSQGEHLAWKFVARTYGTRPEEECIRFFLSDDRTLVRLDWGPDYGNCWCEEVSAGELHDSVPPEMKPELDELMRV